jgi:Mycothiol maleylpyruvate isomerase N-terminal domain
MTEATDRTPAQSQRGAVTIEESLNALRRSATATGELLGSISDSRADAPVPGLAWTVAETAAHLVALLHQSAAFASGARDGAAERALLPASGGIGERMALGNARELDRLGERRIPVLRQLLGGAVDEYATVIAGRRGGPVETLLGPEDPADMTAALVGEQLVHGFDLARAIGQRWTIDPDAARLTLTGLAPFLPFMVDAEAIRHVRARIEVRITGAPRFTLVLDHGRAAVEPADGRCDCWIQAEPVPYLLTGYGRVNRWLPLLRRQIRAGGRRPWIAARLPSYLTSVLLKASVSDGSLRARRVAGLRRCAAGRPRVPPQAGHHRLPAGWAAALFRW